jgi:hypothetical protein
MVKMDKALSALSLTALLLIVAMVFPVSSVTANPCATVDGYLDTGIGIMDLTDDSSPRKGIGGSGRSGDEDEGGKGIGGTGAVGHDNGIGGTGQIASSELIYVTGTIHAFGSVCVNGIEIEYTADTPVSTDTNQKLAASSLQVGQVVDILAEKRVGSKMPKAKNIAVRFPLQGPVTKIGRDKRVINVMGKPVHLGPEAGKSIQLGDSVRVSGLQNTEGQIMATFIETMPKQTPARAAPSKIKVIPSGISNFSVQGYVQRRTPEGRIIINNQSFDLGVSGKDIGIGTRMIISGRRQQNGAIKASSWVRERAVAGTRLRFGETKGSGGHQKRNRGRGRGRSDDGSKEDNSGKGRTNRPDDNNRIDNSGKRSDKTDRVERPDHSGSGKNDRPDRVDRPDNSGGRRDRPERIDRPERSGRPERPDRPEHD